MLSYKFLHKKAKEPNKNKIINFFKKENLVPLIREKVVLSKIFFRDHFTLVFKSSAENYLRIQKLKVNPKEGEQCDLSFNSYSDLKKYQKKVRLFTYSTTSTVASILAVVLIVQIFFPSPKSQGATKTFNQSRWLSQTSNPAAPDGGGNPPASWTEYSAKDANIAIVNGGETGTYLQLSQVADARTDTTRGDFLAGTTDSNSKVTGTSTGDDAGVSLNAASNEIVTGNDSACALKNGSVYCWGNSWQVGNGNVAQPYPGRVKTDASTYLTDVKSISGGGYHYCALKNDATVWCWGSNYDFRAGYGILGIGNTTNGDIFYATQVKDSSGGTPLTGISQIDSGGGTNCGIKQSDGSVYCWGNNWIGVMGNGDTTSRPYATQVSGLTGASKISVGGDYACALKANGTGYCWGGNNSNGKLATGNTTGSYVPVQMSYPNITDIALNGDGSNNRGTTCFVSDGKVYCVGEYTYANYSVVFKAIPSETGTGNLTGVEQLSPSENGNGVFNMCALKSGSVYCWGDNAIGTFGNGTEISSTPSNPVPQRMLAPGGVAGVGPYLTDAVKIAKDRGSYSSMLAIRNDGTIVGSGGNRNSSFIDQTLAANTEILIPSYTRSDAGGTYANVNYYPANGTYTSKTYDFAVKVSSIKLEFNQTTPTGTSIGINVQASNNGSTWTTIKTGAVNNENISAGAGYRYFRYVATLNANSAQTLGPSLDMAKFTATYYPGSQTLTSSIYNTTQDANIISSAAVNGILGANTTVSMQIRTSADGVTWSNWCGATACDNSNNFAFTSLTGSYTTQTINANSSPLFVIGNKKFFQYKLILTSDGQATPSVDQAIVQYVVNNPPIVALSSQPSQTADTGTVNIPYSITGDTAEPTDTYNSALFFSTSNNTGLTLKTAANSTQNTITVTGSDVAYLPSSGYVMIDNEVMSYSGVTVSGSDRILTGVLRGKWPDEIKATLAAAHSSTGVPVYILANNANITTSSGGTGIGNLKNSSGADLPGDTGSYDYTIVWDPKNDTNFNTGGAGRYNSQVKLKVVVNDGNAAAQINTTADSTSNAIAIDVKNPENVTFSIDHANNNVIFKNPSGSIENSQYEILVSNQDNISGATQVLNFAAAKTYSHTYSYSSVLNGASDPITIYAWLRDRYGNLTRLTQTTPAKPSFIQFFDISKSSEDYYAELISWKNLSLTQQNFSGYHLYRAVTNAGTAAGAGDYSLYQSDISTNYYTDNELDSTKQYSYKVATVDTSDNTSVFTEVVSDQPNGVGGSNLGMPTITNAAVSNQTTTSMKVSWTTNDGLTTATVGYKKSGAATYTNVAETAYEKNHSIVLTGLEQGQQYDILITARMFDNTEDTETITGSTIAGPEISNVAITETSNEQATIYWKTNVNSDSTVSYSTAVSNGTLAGTPVSVTGNSDTKEHYVTLTNLTLGQKYFFQVQSAAGINNNGEKFFELNTSNDTTTAPVVTTGPAHSLITSSSALITWTTDQPTTTRLKYKKKSASTWTTLPLVSVFDRNHSIALENLDANETYEYQIVKDASSNLNINKVQIADDMGVKEFTTSKSADQNHNPLSKILNITEVNVMDKNAVVTFDTADAGNESVGALCFVELNGTDGTNVTNSIQYESGYSEEKNFNASHAIPLKNLTAKTNYSYSISCHDNIIKDANAETAANKYGNWVFSEAKNFTTKEEMNTQSGWADKLSGDTNPPVITNVKVSSSTGESAVITWDTDEDSNSLVKYGTDTNYGNMAGDDKVNNNQANYTNSHSVTINGLVPATKYFYVVSSIDASGNIASSSESSFTTAAPSSLSSIKAQSLNLGEATITWETSNETTSTVEYGLTTSYGEKKESSTQTKNHSINLSNLNQGEIYHFRVKGKDADGRLYASADQTFEPKSPPKIEDISINEVTEHEARITFKTNVPTMATAIYTNVQDTSDNGSQSDNELKTEHTINLKNLSQGTTFSLKIKATDEQGTENEEDTKDFTTGKDENPPKIDQVKTDSALTQNDKVQSIVSWKTDEQSTTSLIYKEGKNGEQKEIKISDSLTTSHVSVITIFKPGMVYYFKVKSVDASGNEAISNDFALLTPKRKENIIQIIINNFQDIFGWARR